MTTLPCPPRTHVPPSPDDVADAHHRADVERYMPTLTLLVFVLGVAVGVGARWLGGATS